jgi:hypothetical protein
MATEAARLKNQEPTGRRKTDLTLTGLLMEGLEVRYTITTKYFDFGCLPEER